MIGYVIQNDVPIQLASDRAIKDILKQVDDQPFLPQAVLDLALWAADYYLCGPVAFMAAMQDGLEALGVAGERIHSETFGPATPAVGA